jgi:hypothetical protein
MNYLTQYYKNLSEQLEEKVFNLTALVESRNIHSLNEGTQIGDLIARYGSYAAYMAEVAAGRIKGWWDTVTPQDMTETGVGVMLPWASLPGELLYHGTVAAHDYNMEQAAYDIVVHFASKYRYPIPTIEEWRNAGSPTGGSLYPWFKRQYPNNTNGAEAIHRHYHPNTYDKDTPSNIQVKNPITQNSVLPGQYQA